VEEQFYLVTPLALIALAKSRISMSWAIGCAGLVSFALNIVLVRFDQSAAFYLPFTRFWELLVGGGLAYISLHSPTLLIKIQHWGFSCIGLMLIAGSALTTPFALFPGWRAIPPVLGSALVIAAGPTTAINRALASSPAVAIGLISYPLYLWHWPLLVFMLEDFPLAHGAFFVLLALSLSLAAATYWFVERPARAFRLRPIAIGSFSTMAAIAVAGIATVQTGGLPERYNPPLPAVFLPMPTQQYGGPEVQAGNIAGPKLLLWGDSHAGHLVPGFMAVRQTKQVRIYIQSFSDCPPTKVRAESTRQHCIEEIDKIEKAVALLRPDVAVLASYWPYHDHLEGLAQPLSFLHRIGVPRIVIMGYVPRWPVQLRKVVLKAYLKNPLAPVPERLSNFVQIGPDVEEHLRNAAARFNARYIPPMQTLCNDDGCLVRVGDMAGDLMQFDDNHFTVAGSKFFVGQIAHQILN
jgi:hypothetical protein